MLKKLLTAGLILSLTAILAGGFLYRELSATIDQRVLFEIPSGDNLSSISGRLDSMQLLPSSDFVFKATALLTRDAGPVRAGQYQLEPGMDIRDLLALFRSGKVVQHRLTFPEGITLEHWLELFVDAPYLKQLTPDLSRAELSQVLNIEGDLEGWLFPDTYHYIKDDADVEILHLALTRMQTVLEAEWNRRVPAAGIETPYDALVLASIIEKETGYEPDRQKIAGVFLNRLARNMKLQSDPTVIYGVGPEFDGDLIRAHLREDTPYNTYTRRGLPPTPICSPGLASIQAALSGADHNYLYFVAMGNGRSYFSETLEEHNRAVNRYQKSAP